jgi:hypothetical protein
MERKQKRKGGHAERSSIRNGRAAKMHGIIDENREKNIKYVDLYNIAAVFFGRLRKTGGVFQADRCEDGDGFAEECTNEGVFPGGSGYTEHPDNQNIQ